MIRLGKHFIPLMAVVLALFGLSACGGSDPKKDYEAFLEEIQAIVTKATDENQQNLKQWDDWEEQEHEVPLDAVDSSLEDWQLIWEAAQAKLQEIKVPGSFGKDQKDLAQKALDDYQKAFAALADGFRQYLEARQSDFPTRQPAYQEITKAITYFDQGAKRLEKLGNELGVTDKPVPVPGFDVTTDILGRIHGLPALNRAYDQMVAIVDGPLADWAEDIKKSVGKEEIQAEDLVKFITYAKDEYARRAQEVKAQPVPFIFTEYERSRFRDLRNSFANYAEATSNFFGEALNVPADTNSVLFEIHQANLKRHQQNRDIFASSIKSTYQSLASTLNR
ncbi:MAG: hypothetical protein KM310_11290 [Clostridiales bacterium]|nr:hypothetical protein [Clostridiales bacterium]